MDSYTFLDKEGNILVPECMVETKDTPDLDWETRNNEATKYTTPLGCVAVVNTYRHTHPTRFWRTRNWVFAFLNGEAGKIAIERWLDNKIIAAEKLHAEVVADMERRKASTLEAIHNIFKGVDHPTEEIYAALPWPLSDSFIPGSYKAWKVSNKIVVVGGAQPHGWLLEWEPMVAVVYADKEWPESAETIRSAAPGWGRKYI